MSNSVRPHRRQPTRLPRPWDSPGKNTGVGCHFLLQCMKVNSLSRVRLLATPWTVAHQAPPSMGVSRWFWYSFKQESHLCIHLQWIPPIGTWDCQRNSWWSEMTAWFVSSLVVNELIEGCVSVAKFVHIFNSKISFSKNLGDGLSLQYKILLKLRRKVLT